MDEWKQGAYTAYVTGHATFSHGHETLQRIRSQFPVWQRSIGRFVPPRRTAAILECGAGSGGVVHWLRSIGYTNVLGIDVSEEQVAEAKRLGIEGVRQADVVGFLDGGTERFDCIIALDFIEHFSRADGLRILRLFRGALVPGGTLILRTPSGEGLFAARYRYWDLSHETMFTRASMHHALAIAGFSGARFFSTGPVIHGFISGIRWVLWKVVELFLRLLLLIETGTGAGILTQNMLVVVEAPASEHVTK